MFFFLSRVDGVAVRSAFIFIFFIARGLGVVLDPVSHDTTFTSSVASRISIGGLLAFSWFSAVWAAASTVVYMARQETIVTLRADNQCTADVVVWGLFMVHGNLTPPN